MGRYIPSPYTMTDDKTLHPSLTTPPPYPRIHSPDDLPAFNVTTPTMQKPCVPLLSRTSPQLQNYFTMMQEHQSTWRVMSLDLCLEQDSSLYKGKQGHATLTKSWKNVPIVKALLTHLLNAPSLSKKHSHHYHRGRQALSLYQSRRKTQPCQSTLTVPSNPYQREQGNPLRR